MSYNDELQSNNSELEEILNQVNALPNAGNVDLTGYATENYVQEYAQPKGDYLESSELPTAINTALAQAKERGEFDGAKGDPGNDYVLTPADKSEITAMVIESLGGNPIFGVVDENNNIVVSGDLPDGIYSVTYEMADGSKISIGNLVLDTNVYYSVSNNLTNCTNSNSAKQVVQGNSYTATITAKSGYVLKSVAVTMGGAAVSVSGGTINIASVTGNIVITAVAEEIKVNYTNLADPTSSDWIIGSRFNSSGVPTEESGTAITNYIGGNLATGDVIRVKGMNLTSHRVQIYDKNKAQASLGKLSDSGYYFENITIDSTSASFTIKSSMPANGYIRFSGLLIGTSADVIITRNEEIA